MNEALVEVGLMGGAMLFAWLVSIVVRGPEQRMLRDGVRHLGLTARHALWPRTAVARGPVGVLDVQVRYVDTQPAKRKDQPWAPPSAKVTVRVGLPAPLPGGLRLRSMGPGQHLLEALGAQDVQVGHPRLDEALRIACDDPAEVQALLAEPTLQAQLLRASAHLAGSLEVDPGELRLSRSGQLAVDPRPLVDLAVDLGNAFVLAQQLPWTRLAVTLDLDPGEVGLDGRRRLEGEVDGVRLELRLMAGDEEREPATIIRARLHPPLPGELRLRGKTPGETAGASAQSTGNLVLDTAVVMHCAAPERARALLAQEGLLEPLMELLHGHQGARVTPGAVMLSVPGWSAVGVEERVRLVVEVARRLQEAAVATEPAA